MPSRKGPWYAFFGCLLDIFRTVASLVLGLVIFFGFLGFLLVNNVRDNFLSAEFYTNSLSENDIYNRFYDEVLLDPEYEDTTKELLGDIDVSQTDIADLAREIITTEYLQQEVERAVSGAIDYLNKKSDTLQVFINLGPPLENVKPALFKYIDGRIDELEDVQVATLEELEEALEELFRTLEKGEIPTSLPAIDNPEALVDRTVDKHVAELVEVPVSTTEEFEKELEGVYKQLTNGEVPNRIPSIDIIPVALRGSTYDLVFQAILADPSIPKEVKDGLKASDQEIKKELIEGSVKRALEVAAPQLTAPVIDVFVDDAYDKVFSALKDDPLFTESALDGLDKQSDAIKASLREGNIKEALKLGTRGLAGPLIDDAIERLRREELDDEDRLDLVNIAAEQNDETKEEFLDDKVDYGRTIISRAKVGQWVTIVIIVVSALAMGAVHFPHLASGIRWPGLTLFLSGLLFLILGFILKAQLPGRLEDLLDRTDVSPIPPSMVNIINDVFASMSSDVAGGFVSPSIIVLVIGLGMLIGSFFIRLLHIPFISR